MIAKGNLVEFLNEAEHSTCKMCGTTKRQAIYKFRYAQYISDHIPELLNPVCRKCVYKSVYGSKYFNKKMKERTLDGKE